jgi:hypothetical protein
LVVEELADQLMTELVAVVVVQVDIYRLQI